MKPYRDYVYDLETYNNFFSMVIGDCKTRKCWSFEISERKDQREEMIAFLRHIRKENGRMVGFNNISFDYPVLHYLLTNQKASYHTLYDKAMEIINSFKDEDKFKHIIRNDEVMIPQLDLYKVHHFDNRARATSLKMLEFNMRSDDIQDLPYNPSVPLTFQQMDEVMKYNKHDMYQTFLFYEKSKEQIEFREKLSGELGRDFTNHNDGKIGKDYFIMKMEEEIPGICYKKTRGGGRKVRQTKRDKIDLGQCILPYIKFSRPEFQAVLKWFRQKTITETKGVLSDLYEHELGDVAQYAQLITKKKKLKEKPTEEEIQELQERIPLSWVDEVLLKSGKTSYYWYWNIATNLHVMVNGVRYDFGVGGLHGSIDSATVRSNDEMILVDQDVASYYPNLAIKNRVFPEHLSESFCDIYEDVYNQRKSYAKGTAENAMMKLALNSVYGDSNNQYSPFYDPKYTMTITVGGQLSLCMLAEKLLEIGGLEMVMLNTDGLTYYVPRERYDDAIQVCRDWEKVTKLELEGVDYDMMAIRDVNSYIAVADGGKKIKRKGAYEYDNLDWPKNHSSLVIQKAAEHAIVHGGDVEDFILGHEDIMDFMLRAKIPRSSKLMMVDDDGDMEQTQNICRYYICKDGVKLVKVMPPVPGKEDKGERYIGIDKSWKVAVCNRMSDYKGNIDYDYYIEEANKLVDPLMREKESV